jgi:dephospho-CoA kinase
MIDMLSNLIHDDSQPIIIGLSGKAGSGKTSVAEQIVPKGSIAVNKYGIKWDHIFYALPLYELASIKKNTQGHNERSRKLYAIHETLYEIFGSSPLANVPQYHDLIKMVDEIYNLSIEPEGTKPRTFLQKAGDICRDFDSDCFCKWGVRKAQAIYKNYLRDFYRDMEDVSNQDASPMAIIVSDVRFKNEAQTILDQPNGFVVCFDASQETLNERILKRDGKLMSADQSSHKSESFIDDIMDISSCVINTDNLTIEEQTEQTLKQLGIMEKANA